MAKNPGCKPTQKEESERVQGGACTRDPGKGRATARRFLWEVRAEDAEDPDLPDSLGPGLPLSPQVSYVILISLNKKTKAPGEVLDIWPRQAVGWRAGSGLRLSTLRMLSYA